jgi:hypothetical protein
MQNMYSEAYDNKAETVGVCYVWNQGNTSMTEILNRT